METKTQTNIPSTRVIEPKILYFGTPVVLISSLNEDGSPNLAAMSSAWALGWTIMLGLGTGGKTLENLSQRPECVLNFPSEDLWQAVERMAPLTGKDPVPSYKQSLHYRYEKDKFAVAGFSPIPSEQVSAPRVAECPLQMEGIVQKISLIGGDEDESAAVEVKILKVHAHENIMRSINHIDPQLWHPLIYNFRHYYGLGSELGRTFRAET